MAKQKFWHKKKTFFEEQFQFDWFGGISTLVSYLMPNPVYIYIYIYIHTHTHTHTYI